MRSSTETTSSCCDPLFSAKRGKGRSRSGRLTGTEHRRPKDGTIIENPALRHWHVVITLVGEPIEPMLVRAGLLRLSEQRPFLESMRFSTDRAEIRFWDEGESMLDVASLALRLWSEHRESAGLPRWEVVGLEVVEKTLRDRGGDGAALRSALSPIAF